MEHPPGPRRRDAGDLLLRTGAVVTVVGLACTAIALIPLVVPAVQLPPVWWFLSMVTGVGLAMVIVGLAVSAISRSRRGRSAAGGTTRAPH